jgi:hypothetical protein
MFLVAPAGPFKSWNFIRCCAIHYIRGLRSRFPSNPAMRLRSSLRFPSVFPLVLRSKLALHLIAKSFGFLGGFADSKCDKSARDCPRTQMVFCSRSLIACGKLAFHRSSSRQPKGPTGA